MGLGLGARVRVRVRVRVSLLRGVGRLYPLAATLELPVAQHEAQLVARAAEQRRRVLEATLTLLVRVRVRVRAGVRVRVRVRDRDRDRARGRARRRWRILEITEPNECLQRDPTLQGTLWFGGII